MFQLAFNVAKVYALIGTLIVPAWAIFLAFVAGYLTFGDN
jgi:hypothetical protein